MQKYIPASSVNNSILFSSHQESPSCPPENRPSGTRKNQASFPFHSGNPTTFSSIFNFQFSDSMTSASVSASKPLLLLFHSAISLSLINQAFFLLSRSFSGLKRRDWWLGTGMHRVDAAAKKEAGPDEFLWNSSDSASYFLCSFSLGHLDESGWDENKWIIQTLQRLTLFV